MPGAAREKYVVDVSKERRTRDRALIRFFHVLASSGRLWTLFGLLVVLQAMDLATTYLALARGAHEGNPILRDFLFTPAVPVLKALALAFLATLIVRSASWGRPAPVRLLAVTRLIVVIYIGIVANNALLILRVH
jgi:uncharacterized protein DUF5658